MYAEYPMIRFLEANGYDVSYTSGVDVSQPGYASTIEQHKIFMDAGHDEYWTGQQRANVTGRPRRRASTWRSSAGTRCSGRPGWNRASTGRTRRTGRW